MSVAWPAGVRRWSIDELVQDAAASRADFRARRLGEPLARYLAAFDAASPVLAPLIEQLEVALAGGPAASALLSDVWKTDLGRTAFRYLGAPPISTDDLETLAEARLSAAALDGAGADKLLDVMRVIADPRRFPWLADRRAATPAERDAAQLASAVLVASQRVQTLRRGDEKSAVEGAVKGLLVGMGWQPAGHRPAKGVQKLLTDSPEPRNFLTQPRCRQRRRRRATGRWPPAGHRVQRVEQRNQQPQAIEQGSRAERTRLGRPLRCAGGGGRCTARRFQGAVHRGGAGHADGDFLGSSAG